jgi:tRNA(Ile)-lysidine synthase
VRPLLDISKEELLEYLNRNGYKYFIDKTNSDIRYERNYFRREFSDKLIEKYRDGIRRSFEYLNRDKEILLDGYSKIYSYKKLYILKLKNRNQIERVADIYLKRLGYLLSSAQREEIKNKKSIVVGGLWVVEVVDDLLYISPYIKTTMPKRFKEECRVLKIPPKVRGYIYRESILDSIIESISLD